MKTQSKSRELGQTDPAAQARPVQAETSTDPETQKVQDLAAAYHRLTHSTNPAAAAAAVRDIIREMVLNG